MIQNKLSIKNTFVYWLFSIGITTVVLSSKLYSDPFLKVHQGQDQLYYSLSKNDSLTFEPLDLKGYYMLIHRSKGNDTLAPNSVDSFKVVNIERLAEISVMAGNQTRVNVPISAGISDAIAAQSELKLVELVGNKRVPTPFQIETDVQNKLWWILSGSTQIGQTRTFEIEKSNYTSPVSPVKIVEENGFLKFKWNSAKILNYVITPIKPPGTIDNYMRNGYINELYSPVSQHLMVEDGPADHEHHRSVFFVWKHLLFEGRTLDIWHSLTNDGNIFIDTVEKKITGPIYTGIKSKHTWVEHLNNKHLILETYDIKVWNVGGPASGYWLWDLSVKHTPGTTSPVEIKNYEYGGMCYRGAQPWDAAALEMLTSGGFDKTNSLRTKARWNSISGNNGGTWTSTNILAHPDNPIHPEGAQNYINLSYIGFTTTQDSAFTMEVGKEYEWKYRYYVHEGKIVSGTTESFWQDYGNPPIVNITEF